MYVRDDDQRAQHQLGQASNKSVIKSNVTIVARRGTMPAIAAA
jgi:hypothetical protein